jgi:hydroxypyruvate reductase/glycerate 2-kinase
MDERECVRNIFSAAVAAVDPFVLVKEHAVKIFTDVNENKFKKIYVTGFGKASYEMARSIAEINERLITEAVVITKYGHAQVKNKEKELLNKIKVFEAGHPIPDENGMKATEEIIHLLNKADRDTLVLFLVSGGGSALLVSPYEGLDLAAKQDVTDLLLKAGADITELNTVRKHLSRVKGGRLAEIAYPAEMISLIISDVIEDKLDVIASGPTTPDSSTFSDAIRIIRNCGIEQRTPENVKDFIIRGSKGLIPETPKQGNRIFEKVHNIIIGNNHKALIAAKEKAESLGFESEITSSNLTGEAKDIGKRLAEKAKQIKSSRTHGFGETICLISGGETTVTVIGKGKGGRNTELALGFAKEIKGIEGITLLSAGTDGTDGPTDAAGAVVDGNTVIKAKNRGLDPDSYLNRNDSYTFFQQVDALLITGPTGTNVMDAQILLISAG